MKTITIGGNEYTLEFTFEAVSCKELFQKMFNVMAGTYFVKNAEGSTDAEVNKVMAMFNGMSDMLSDIPGIVKTAFYAGLLEHHHVTAEQAYDLQKQYMKENKLSFKALNDELQAVMVDDGFFDLSGLTEATKVMSQTVADAADNQPKKSRKNMTAVK